MRWWPRWKPEECYQATYWRLVIYFVGSGENDHRVAIRSDDRNQIKNWAREIRDRMGPQVVLGPLYTIEINDQDIEMIDCSRVERVMVASATETRRRRDDAVVTWAAM